MSKVIPIVQGNIIQSGNVRNDNSNEIHHQQPQTSLLSPDNNNNGVTGSTSAIAAINNPYNQYQEPPQPYTNNTNNNQAYPPNSHNRPYRGFSTSICSLFNKSPRIDCCSIAFCGLLQWDYNYYLITNEQPPSLWNRALRHIFIPLLLFLAAAYCATNIDDQRTNELSVTILILLLMIYIIIDCVLIRIERIKFRKRLLDTLSSSSSPSDNNTSSSATHHHHHLNHQQYHLPTTADYFCAHRMCGFYTCDDEDNDFIINESTNNDNDLCSTIWQFFACLCCGKCCHCWVQCCGICAIAQEGREIALYVGKEHTMIDYITFEPFYDYFPKILHLRMTENNSLFDHYGALSNLSSLMLRTLLICIAMLALLSILDYHESFTWVNLLVFIATFTQAFIILYFVHWKWNRFDISLDAIIKYFSSGFLISTTIAIFFETIQSLLLNIFFNILVLINSATTTQEDNSNNNLNENYSVAWKKSEIISKMKNYYSKLSDDDYNAGHFIIVVMYFLCTSFFVAALVEEMCKYYAFLVVDHPDMFQDSSIFLNNLIAENDTDDDDEDGGDSTSHESSSIKPHISLNQNDDSNEINIPDPINNIVVNSPSSNPPSAPITTTTPIVTERKLNSMGSAITIGMITVAMGFACCENLVYIFIYTGGSGNAGMEIATLLARSLFPVHPLCAAIQSINVCRRILEKDDSYGVGYIILPSLLLHGSYDFSLMLMSFLFTDSSNDDNNNEDNNDNADEDSSIGLVSFLIAFGIVILGFTYYFIESNKQKKRLNSLEVSGNTMSLI